MCLQMRVDSTDEYVRWKNIFPHFRGRGGETFLFVTAFGMLGSSYFQEGLALLVQMRTFDQRHLGEDIPATSLFPYE